MRSASTSIIAWSIYMLLIGLGFTLVPNLVLPIFGLPTTDEVWVRVAGLLVGFTAIYYYICGRQNVGVFIRATVPVRLGFAAGLALLAALRLGGAALFLFAALDILGAAWTWWALRSAVVPAPAHA